ncbi:MAG TPA: hypothetical protein VFE89_10025, partial [Beijerinckiaceae bacterium]|nr:hypothetical protein [Beijerinckiaceae bacterium]
MATILQQIGTPLQLVALAQRLKVAQDSAQDFAQGFAGRTRQFDLVRSQSSRPDASPEMSGSDN